MDDFTAGLHKKGYRRIGAGAFAQVYAKPGCDTVLKIGHNDSNKSYLEYITSSSKHLNNPLFPKIFKITKYEVTGDSSENYFAVEMEKLAKLPPNIDFGVFDKNDTPRLGTHAIGKYLYSLVFEGSVQNKTVSDVENSGISVNYDKKHQKECYDLLSCLKRRFALDLHSNNVMLRKLGTRQELVITDPVWDCSPC
jgi:hypothetical protein